MTTLVAIRQKPRDEDVMSNVRKSNRNSAHGHSKSKTRRGLSSIKGESENLCAGNETRGAQRSKTYQYFVSKAMAVVLAI